MTENLNLEWVPMSVPVPVAQDWISNWILADPNGKALNPKEMRAFVVRKEDFTQLLKQIDTEFVRLYVGRKNERDEVTGEEHLRPCLLLVSAAYRKDVAVVEDGEDPDTIIDLVGEMTVKTPDAEAGETYDYEVFDFTRPCPPRCDDDSILFIDGADKSFC